MSKFLTLFDNQLFSYYFYQLPIITELILEFLYKINKLIILNIMYANILGSGLDFVKMHKVYVVLLRIFLSWQKHKIFPYIFAKQQKFPPLSHL